MGNCIPLPKVQTEPVNQSESEKTLSNAQEEPKETTNVEVVVDILKTGDASISGESVLVAFEDQGSG